MGVVIGEVQVVVAVDRDAVRQDELARSPGFEKVDVAIANEDRVVSPAEYIDIVV